MYILEQRRRFRFRQNVNGYSRMQFNWKHEYLRTRHSSFADACYCVYRVFGYDRKRSDQDFVIVSPFGSFTRYWIYIYSISTRSARD